MTKKTQISITIDQDVYDAVKAQGINRSDVCNGALKYVVFDHSNISTSEKTKKIEQLEKELKERIMEITNLKNKIDNIKKLENDEEETEEQELKRKEDILSIFKMKYGQNR